MPNFTVIKALTMLKNYLYISCLSFLFSICLKVNAQTTIRNFYVWQSQKSVEIGFIVESAQYCTGYQIQRSADAGSEFNVIYDYPSICGDNPEVKSVVYYDKDPVKNSISYYRIHVPPSTFSEVQSIIFHESPDTGYILYSNPVNETFKLKVNASHATVELFNTLGRKVVVFTTNSEGMINENIQTLPNGVYYFLIRTMDNYFLKGKFVKAH